MIAQEYNFNISQIILIYRNATACHYEYSSWPLGLVIFFLFFTYRAQHVKPHWRDPQKGAKELAELHSCVSPPLGLMLQWENLEVEMARQNCYSWKALLLKFINENTQGGRSEQKEWKTCLAFLDFSSGMRTCGELWVMWSSHVMWSSRDSPAPPIYGYFEPLCIKYKSCEEKIPLVALSATLPLRCLPTWGGTYHKLVAFISFSD